MCVSSTSSYFRSRFGESVNTREPELRRNTLVLKNHDRPRSEPQKTSDVSESRVCCTRRTDSV